MTLRRSARATDRTTPGLDAAPVPLTPTASFDATWPEVERRLRRLLGKRGIASAEASDYVQEVASRAIANDVRFVSADDLYRWCAVVCRNLTIDAARRHRYRSVPLDLELPHHVDLEAAVIQSAMVRRLLDEVAALEPEERQLLMGESTDQRLSSGALTTRRHRLRKTLRDRLESAKWGLLGSRMLRRLGFVRHCDVLAEVAQASAVAVVLTVSLFSAAGRHAPPNVAAPAFHISRPIAAQAPRPSRPPVAVAASDARPEARTAHHRAPSAVPDLPNQHLGVAAATDAPTVDTNDRMDDDKILCLGNSPVGPLCTPR